MAKHAHLNPPVGPHDHSQGSAGALVTLVEYGDYQCPYCGMAYPIMKRIQKRLGNRLRFVFRNFPLAESHPLATSAAQMAEAAALQDRFWQMHDALYEHQDALDPASLLQYARDLRLDIGKLESALRNTQVIERVQSDFMSGVRSGVNGTPTFFIGEDRFNGDWANEDEFAAALAAAANRG